MRRTIAAGTAAGLLAAALPSVTRAGDAPALPALVWALAPSDVAVYDVAPVTAKNGLEQVGASRVRTVYGHDLREKGEYRPVSCYRADLPSVLALYLPGRDAPSPALVGLRVEMSDTTDLEGRGSVSRRLLDDGRAEVKATWTFASRGNPEKGEAFDLADGTADVSAVFDVGRGVVAWSRVKIAYVPRRWVQAKGEKPVRVDETWDVSLRDVRRTRREGFSKAVGEAIDRGVTHLKTLAKPDGTFPAYREWLAGTTALCVLTLAECGVPREDPTVEKGLAYLVSAHSPPRTYELATALMAFDRAYTPPGEDVLLATGRIAKAVRALPDDRRAWCERVAATLETKCDLPGSWGYPYGPGSACRCDSSNTQYGALGMRAASRLGIPVKEATWLGLIHHFDLLRVRGGPSATLALGREGERPLAPGTTVAGTGPATVPEVGGFLYSGYEKRPEASMACAAIACLELARHELVRTHSPKWTPPLGEEVERRILGAWAWLDRHWGVDRSPERASNDWDLYYLYSLERAGVFSRVRTVGGKDWYFEGATQLLLRQASDGAWTESGANDATIGTCFALLFLKKATAPLTASEGN